MVFLALRRGELGERLIEGVREELRHGASKNRRKASIETLVATDREPNTRPLTTGRVFGSYFDNLSLRAKRLIVGIYEEGRSFEDVAARLGISVERAERLHEKTLELIRRELTEDVYSE